MEQPSCRRVESGQRKRAWSGTIAEGDRVVAWLEAKDRDDNALIGDRVPDIARRVELEKILVPGLMPMELIDQPGISQEETMELREEPGFGVSSQGRIQAGLCATKR